jgi:hypothetical protein
VVAPGRSRYEVPSTADGEQAPTTPSTTLPAAVVADYRENPCLRARPALTGRFASGNAAGFGARHSHRLRRTDFGGFWEGVSCINGWIK